MNKRPHISWSEANQAHLAREFARLRARFPSAHEAEPEEPDGGFPREYLDSPPAIERLASLFGLSPFERDVVLLAAGVELDSELAAFTSEALGRERSGAITFSLALATLSDPHWSALAPNAPLRRFHLVEIETERGLTTAPLRIDERILHYVAGVNVLDPRLEVLLQFKGHPHWIADRHRTLALETIAAFEPGLEQPPLLHLCGDDPLGQEDIASLMAVNAARQLYLLRAENVPASAAEIDQFIALWSRESLLLPAVLLVQCGSSALSVSTRRLVERLPAQLILASRDPLRLDRSTACLTISPNSSASAPKPSRRSVQPSYRATAQPIPTVFGISAVRLRVRALKIWRNASSLRPPGPTWSCPTRKRRSSISSLRRPAIA